MADFVLVHGAWHGAWCWQKIVPPLWAAGHRVFTVTLTGVGERAHLLSKAITLDTHIADVVAVIESEELLDPILVGHSYAGVVLGFKESSQRWLIERKIVGLRAPRQASSIRASCEACR